MLLVLIVTSVPATEIGSPSHGKANGPADRHYADLEAIPLSLERAVEITIKDNPSIVELQARADALGAVPSQAGTLPDPRLGFNALNLPTDTFALDQEPMTQLQLTVSQAVPFPGKLGLKRKAAEFDAAAAGTRVEDRRLALAAEVRSAWWKLFYLDRALEIVDQNQQLMRQFVEIAQTKYKVGKGLQQDVLLAQLELSRLLDRELGLRGMREATQASVNALLNQPTDRPLRLLPRSQDKALPNLPGEAELLVRAQETQPLLAEQRQLIEAARARLDLAKKDYYPDFRLGAGYGFRQGNDPLQGRERPDFLTLRFGVNVPIYFQSKQGKAVDQRTHEFFERKFSLQDTLRSVQAAISQRFADYQAARQEVLLLRTGIIPQAQQTVSAMLAAYQVNQVDFLNVVSAQITLYNAQIDHWEALSKAKQALAGLAAAVGVDALYE